MVEASFGQEAGLLALLRDIGGDKWECSVCGNPITAEWKPAIAFVGGRKRLGLSTVIVEIRCGDCAGAEFGTTKGDSDG